MKVASITENVTTQGLIARWGKESKLPRPSENAPELLSLNVLEQRRRDRRHMAGKIKSLDR